jgi:hypothetical protein
MPGLSLVPRMGGYANHNTPTSWPPQVPALSRSERLSVFRRGQGGPQPRTEGGTPRYLSTQRHGF